jgi:hypothetical protein
MKFVKVAPGHFLNLDAVVRLHFYIDDYDRDAVMVYSSEPNLDRELDQKRPTYRDALARELERVVEGLASGGEATSSGQHPDPKG